MAILDDAGWRDVTPAEFFGYTPEEFAIVLRNARKAVELGKSTNTHRFILRIVEEREKLEAKGS